MPKGPREFDHPNRDLRQVQGAIREQFREKQNVQARTQRILKIVIAVYGLVLLTLGLVFWIQGSTAISLLSVENIINIVETTRGNSFLVPYHPTLVLAVGGYGSFTLVSFSLYSIFAKFLPLSIKVLTFSDLQTGVKPSRYKVAYTEETDEKEEKLLLLDLLSALEYNQTALARVNKRAETAFNYLQRGITLLVGTVGFAAILLISQSAVGILLGGCAATISALVLLCDQVTIEKYQRLLVVDPLTDVAILSTIIAIIPLSVFSQISFPTVILLVVPVVLSYILLPLLYSRADFEAQSLLLIRTLFLSAIYVLFIGLLQVAVPTLPPSISAVSTGIIFSLLYCSIGMTVVIALSSAREQFRQSLRTHQDNDEM